MGLTWQYTQKAVVKSFGGTGWVKCPWKKLGHPVISHKDPFLVKTNQRAPIDRIKKYTRDPRLLVQCIQWDYWFLYIVCSLVDTPTTSDGKRVNWPIVWPLCSPARITLWDSTCKAACPFLIFSIDRFFLAASRGWKVNAFGMSMGDQ